MGFWKLFSYIKTLPRSYKYNITTARTCCSNKTPECSNKPPESSNKPPECSKKPTECSNSVEVKCSVQKVTKDSKQSSTSDGGKKGIVVGVYESEKEFKLSCAAQELNQKLGGKLCTKLNDLSSHLQSGRVHILTDLVADTTVALTYLGSDTAKYNKLEELDEARENIRLGVGAAVRSLQREGCTHVAVDGAGAPDAAAEAAHLASWKFEEFKSSSVRSPTMTLTQLENTEKGSDDLRGSWERGTILGCCQNWARFLADMPANTMAPVDLAQAALDMLCPLGVSVDARDYHWIKANNMQAFMAVARGSCETPVFLECFYSGGGSQPPILIAAKGVTFDSGGLCLKRAASMTENRGSMAGAAAALAALKAAALLKIPLNIACVIPICENMVSGQCMKVGDVVRALNGISIQIEHTDLEGRLMLADALVYGQHKHKPSLVIDVATFTHGILLATGGGAFGCFSNTAGAWSLLQKAGAATGDRPWRFPLWMYYHHQITNEPAVDLRNMGSGRATPCLGAAFLRNFICGPWMHLDITGVGKLGADRAPPYLSPRRMTGRPTRTLAAFLELQAEYKTKLEEDPAKRIASV